MSQTDIFDTDDGTTDDDGTENLVTLKRSQIRGIEKKAKERDQLVAELEKAQRRLAFAEAGVPLGEKRFQYFIRGYEGELTPDAIRAELEEAGLLDRNAPQAGQTTVDGQVERQAISDTLAAGDGGGQPTSDPMAGMFQAFEQGGGQGVVDYLRSQGVVSQQ